MFDMLIITHIVFGLVKMIRNESRKSYLNIYYNVY